MKTRFCLYGFFKNQQYFEPFLILIFLEKGLSFFEIGLLVACRELSVNLLEVLTGVVADLYGRRRSMIASFAAYIASFIVFGLSSNVALLFLAMVLFGVGEAFRTGTHKAMILTWLKSQGREKEKTAFYGHTRSWSKLGSALSVVVAAAFVLISDRLTLLFYLALLPYAAGIINFLGYPKELDFTAKGPSEKESRGARRVVRHLRSSLSDSLKNPFLRRILFESMGFEGFFRASKDYLQPILQAAAVPLVAALALSDDLGEPQQAALLIGPVYLGLYLLSAYASRNAHRVVAKARSEDGAARWLWAVALVVFVVMLPAMIFDFYPALIAGFVVLYALQNVFRPILISRIDDHCQEEQGATILSIENQVKSLSTMLLAPLIGGAVDLVRAHPGLGGDFWPLGALGCALTLPFLLWPMPRGETSACQEREPSR